MLILTATVDAADEVIVAEALSEVKRCFLMDREILGMLRPEFGLEMLDHLPEADR